jgi:hypothetical protein
MKYCKLSGIVQWSGGSMLLHHGMTADDDHPLVLERPDLWGDEGPAPALRSETSDGEPRVERATRGPGEKRGGTSRG